MGAIIGNTGRATPGFQEANIGKLYETGMKPHNLRTIQLKSVVVC
jgi:hypothetical protein